jgi:hypothetical protein
MGVVIEQFDSRLQSDADDISERSQAVFTYYAGGFADESSAMAAVRAECNDWYGKMRYHSMEVAERLNNKTSGGEWRIRVKYVAPPASKIQYDSTGGTQHVTEADETVSRIGPDASTEIGNAIGFDGENVTGVDKIVPQFTWTETHYLTDEELNVPAYYQLTGRVNAAPFKGYAAGEVLFYGITGQKTEDGFWEFSFKFGYQPNSAALEVGDLVVPAKDGWDYLWIYYAKTVSRIYKRGYFSALGIEGRI